MKNKISTSGSTWKYGGFTKMHYWIFEINMGISMGLGLTLLLYAFTSRNTFTYETLHILVLIAVGIFLLGIVFSLLNIFELLFFIGADRLGLLSKNDDDDV